jgi:D-alanyl-D-alanine carboxypeptidase (penicillin-binding protein 5/6)
MTRSQILKTLAFEILLGLGLFVFWVGQNFIASNNVASPNQVLAAHREEPAALLPYPTISTEAKQPAINARSYVLYQVDSGKALVAKNADQEVPIASTTKLMTAYLVTKYGTLTDVTTASNYAIEQGGSVMGLKRGESMTVDQLLYGLLLVSGNDAAHTLSEYTGKKLLNDPQATAEAATARFVEEMNTQAAALKLSHTHYLDPAGLSDDGHSTALDLGKLASVVLHDPVLHKIATTPTYTAQDVTGTIKHDMKDSNRLVSEYNYEGAGLGKTGFTPAAGHCLVASAQRNGTTYVAVILSTYSLAVDASAQEARRLLDWGFNSVRFE